MSFAKRQHLEVQLKDPEYQRDMEWQLEEEMEQYFEYLEELSIKVLEWMVSLGAPYTIVAGNRKLDAGWMFGRLQTTYNIWWAT